MMDFYKQAMELDKNRLSILGEIELSHPYTVNRIREAIRFYRSEKYRNFAAMQGKMGTSTLQGSIATGDLMQKIANKAQNQQVHNPQNSNQNIQSGLNQSPINQSSNINLQQKPASFCKKCGTPIKPNSRFCTTCGTQYDQMDIQNSPVNIQEDIIPVVGIEEIAVTANTKKCPNCGEEINNDAAFCTECGYKF
jgi:rRNA maturation endonuclease Nob1